MKLFPHLIDGRFVRGRTLKHPGEASLDICSFYYERQHFPWLIRTAWEYLFISPTRSDTCYLHLLLQHLPLALAWLRSHGLLLFSAGRRWSCCTCSDWLGWLRIAVQKSKFLLVIEGVILKKWKRIYWRGKRFFLFTFGWCGLAPRACPLDNLHPPTHFCVHAVASRGSFTTLSIEWKHPSSYFC